MIAFNVRAAFAMVLGTPQERDEFEEQAERHRTLTEAARTGAAELRARLGG